MRSDNFPVGAGLEGTASHLTGDVEGARGAKMLQLISPGSTGNRRDAELGSEIGKPKLYDQLPATDVCVGHPWYAHPIWKTFQVARVANSEYLGSM
jgi:hypothetical protein